MVIVLTFNFHFPSIVFSSRHRIVATSQLPISYPPISHRNNPPGKAQFPTPTFCRYLGPRDQIGLLGELPIECKISIKPSLYLHLAEQDIGIHGNSDRYA